MSTTAQTLIDADAGTERAITSVLERFGPAALELARRAGTRIVPLARGERYSDRSQALQRLEIDVDAWPAPPAGLFVVEERTVYLRSRSPMTVAHEFGHAIDCALGNGVYHSSIDPELRALFARATKFVTPYAATAADEYFAESLRAYVEVNDPQSFWPRATRARLRQFDTGMFDYIEGLFRSEFSGPRGARGPLADTIHNIS